MKRNAHGIYKIGITPGLLSFLYARSQIQSCKYNDKSKLFLRKNDYLVSVSKTMEFLEFSLLLKIIMNILNFKDALISLFNKNLYKSKHRI